MKEFYSSEDLKLMRIAESSRLIGKNRVEEIKNFARKSGIKRVGIAYCVALKKEAQQLAEMLKDEFEVFSVDCFIGRIPSNELLNDGSRGIACNPAGQAKFLSDNHTELNIVLGLCMGHDIVFNQKSKSPVTTLVVKDREFNHNPVQLFK